jgi:O-antigen/teichoic acid export membrane protein
VKLARHTLFNLVGLGTPLLAAVVSIPPLISSLGSARFGLLTLIWAVVSYFSLFDLGLGRALTQRLADIHARNSQEEIGPTVGTAMSLMACIGLGAGLLLALLAPWAAGHISQVTDYEEVRSAVLIMAVSIPVVVMTTGLRGILEARHAFGMVNLIRLPMGLYTFLGPLAVVYLVAPRIDLIAVALLAGRVLALAAHLWAALSVMPIIGGELQVRRASVRPMLLAGGWLSVGNLVGPLIGYADRFIIAAIVSASAVAHYATAHELVTKLWIVPGALTAVLFPTFAESAAMRDGRSWPIAMQGVRWLFVVLLPITLALSLFAQEILSVWIGSEFARESAPVLRLLAVGIFVNCLAHVPLTLLQGAGSARAPALLQAAQVLPYVALMAWATQCCGVVGAAMLWVARMVFDTVLMFLLCARAQSIAVAGLAPSPRAATAALIAGASFALAFTPAESGARVLTLIAAATACVWLLRPRRVTPE